MAPVPGRSLISQRPVDKTSAWLNPRGLVDYNGAPSTVNNWSPADPRLHPCEVCRRIELKPRGREDRVARPNTAVVV
jgi:hypothetical protein